MGASSDTEICNRALAEIGARSTIASLSEASPEAKKCNLFYTATRDELMSKAHWNFAKKTATLALLKSAPGTPSNPAGAEAWSSAYPAPPWLYEYAYPSDCLQLRYIIPQVNTGVIGVPLTSNNGGMYPYVMGPVAKWEAATDTDDTGAQINVVLTNQYQAIGVYTMRITNPQLFSDTFVDALVFALAAKLVYPITGERGRTNDLYGMANDQILEARANDGNEGLQTVNSEADWIRIRTCDTFPDGYNYYVAPYSPLYTVW